MLKNGDAPALIGCQVKGPEQKEHRHRYRTGRRGAGERASDHQQLTPHDDDHWHEVEAQSDDRDGDVRHLADRGHVEEEKPLVGQRNSRQPRIRRRPVVQDLGGLAHLVHEIGAVCD